MDNYYTYHYHFNSSTRDLLLKHDIKAYGTIHTIDSCMDFSRIPFRKGNHAQDQNCEFTTDGTAHINTKIAVAHGTYMGSIILDIASDASILNTVVKEKLKISELIDKLEKIVSHKALDPISDQNGELFESHTPVTILNFPVVLHAVHNADAVLVRIVELLCSMNVLLVVPLGNGASNIVPAPAGTTLSENSEDCLVRVGALSIPDGSLYKIYNTSNWDHSLEMLFAPGEKIPAYGPLSDTRVFVSGTCPASAIVAATLALMRSCNPMLSAKELKDVLYKSSIHSHLEDWDVNAKTHVFDIASAISGTCINTTDY